MAVVVAETRALAEDAREKIRVDYEELPFVLDAEAAYQPGSVPVHPEHGSERPARPALRLGRRGRGLRRGAAQLSYRVKWGRSATVPIETFGVVASWDPWREMLDVWASIQMPKFADQIARALRMPHERGARALRMSMSAAATASSAASSTPCSPASCRGSSPPPSS